MSYNAPIDNPYNPDSNDEIIEQLPLDEIIRRAIQAELLKARVMLPAKIIKKNSSQNVDIQPLYKTRYIDGAVVDLPPIQHVPVSMIMGSDYSIKIPISIGDLGYVIFSDRDLDSYLASNGEILEPNSSRIHNYADAIFIPGLVPFSMEVQDATTDLVITNGKAKFKIQKAGKFAATNGTDELKTLAKTLSTDTTNTMLGSMKLNAFSDYNTISSAVDTIKGKIEGLKGV
jgi:hypothetical protein